MPRYINAVIAAETISEHTNIQLADLADVFAGIPTADVVEVRRGEWDSKHHTITLDNMTICGTYPTCNLCDYAEVGMSKNTNYCPNCGAHMKGAENDG